MCGRYTLGREPSSLLDYFHLHGEVPAYHLSYNIAPSQLAPVILQNQQQQRICQLMRWGLVPSWSKGPDARFNMINAKAETIEQKPAYKNAFRQKRCLVPCDGFYEWHAQGTSEQKSGKGKVKQPYYISKTDKSVIAMAGIWDAWTRTGQTAEHPSQVIYSFSIITTDANSAMEQIHHRMPVILKPEAFDCWLSNNGSDLQALKALLVPYQEDDLMLYPVSTAVNSPKNDSVELIAPVAL